MIIYNVTINIDDSVHVEWLKWIKEHIPQVLATGKFEKATLTKVLVEEELGGHTYSVQYRSYSREALDAYYKEDAENMRTEGLKNSLTKCLLLELSFKLLTSIQ